MDAEQARQIGNLTFEVEKFAGKRFLASKLDELTSLVKMVDFYPKSVVARCRRCAAEAEHIRRPYEDAIISQGISQLNFPKLAMGAYLKFHPFAKAAARLMNYIPTVAYVCDACKQVSPMGANTHMIYVIDVATGEIDFQTDILRERS